MVQYFLVEIWKLPVLPLYVLYIICILYSTLYGALLRIQHNITDSPAETSRRGKRKEDRL